MPRKIAFYPCCGRDVQEPLSILTGMVDEVIFCDISPRHRESWKAYEQNNGVSRPQATFITNDVRVEVDQLTGIDVLFYRRDTEGEGGSGIFVLGDSFLSPFLKKFNPAGGFIITDGSNSRGGNFERMKRKSGLIKHDYQFNAQEEQPLLDAYDLWMITVTPSISDHS